MIAPEKAFSVFGSHATKKDDRELSSLWRYISNLNTVLSDQQQKKNVYLLARPSGMFSKSGPPLAFFFISSHFFSLISLFQADLFDSWGGGAFAPIASLPPCLRA